MYKTQSNFCKIAVEYFKYYHSQFCLMAKSAKRPTTKTKVETYIKGTPKVYKHHPNMVRGYVPKGSKYAEKKK